MDRIKARKIQKRFGNKFNRKTGVLKGGDGTPVTLSGISCSLFCARERAKEFGCDGRTAILVEWLPAGLTHGDWPKNGGFPKETGVNKKKISDKSTWVTFPRKFEGLPVYYKRGGAIFAL